MAATYKSKILHRWFWDKVVAATRDDALGLGSKDDHTCSDGCDRDGHVGSAYLGSVMNNTPSGKFYAPWSTNATSAEREADSRWFEALEAVANRHDGWIESGEGDPTDLYFMRYWPAPERND